MWNINILTKCDDENVRVAIISAVNEILSVESNIIVNRMKHGRINSPVWNTISRQENLGNKF